MLKRIYILGFAFIALGLVSCDTNKGLHRKNVAQLYQQQNVFIKPQLSVYHSSQTQTKVFFEVPSTELLYKKSKQTGEFEASLDIEYKLYNSYEDLTVNDSSRQTIADKQIELGYKKIKGSFDVKTLKPQKYLLVVTMVDKNRDYTYTNYIELDKINPNNRQNFKVTNQDGKVLSKPYINSFDSYVIEYNKPSVKELYVSFYKREFPLPKPPFSITSNEPYDMAPRSEYTISTGSEIQFNEPGIYHIRAEKDSKDGITLYYFNDDYPLVTKVSHVADPLRYITSKKEYKKIDSDNTDSLKIAVDNFWLKNAGSPDRARRLISTYYGRVQDANNLFATHTEGWKTDRGLIYVIYGPPNIIYRSTSGESWVYGKEGGPLSYYFNFLKINSPYSDNDYELTRQSGYRHNWSQAVDSWRRGRVFNVDDIQREQDEYEQQNRLRGQSNPYFWY